MEWDGALYVRLPKITRYQGTLRLSDKAKTGTRGSAWRVAWRS